MAQMFLAGTGTSSSIQQKIGTSTTGNSRRMLHGFFSPCLAFSALWPMTSSSLSTGCALQLRDKLRSLARDSCRSFLAARG